MLYDLCEKKDIPATFFELTTALAMRTFAKANCDAVVLEVGLGGRLDATNILKRPALSIITSVQLDHMHILGDNVEKIAIEKAGIMKAGVPVLVGPDVPLSVLQAEAKRYQADLFTIADVLPRSEVEIVSTQRYYASGRIANTNHPSSLPENVDDKIFPDQNAESINANLAKAAMKLLQIRAADKLRSRGFSNWSSGLWIRPPCRFEIISIRDADGREVDVVLDIAHNYDGMKNLINTFQSVYGIAPVRDVRVVVGMSADKDINSSIELIMQLVHGDPHRVYCAQVNI
jgi:dihydrofolate synthase / folylpolyglutamate synthase